MSTTLRNLPFITRPCLRLSAFAAAALLGGLLIATAAPASAQSVEDQLERLQREVSDLQRQVYGGAAPAAGGESSGGGLAPTQAANLQLQVNQLEVQLQELTGRVEDMSFQMQSVSDRLDKLVADVDLRLRNLEQGGQMPMAGATAQDDMMANQMAVGGQPAAPAAPAAQPAPTSPAQPGSIGTISETDLDSFQRQQASEAELAAQRSAAASETAPQTAAVAPATTVLPAGTPQEQYDYAFGLLRQANYRRVRSQALRRPSCCKIIPRIALAGNAKYWLGETFYVRGDFQ